MLDVELGINDLVANDERRAVRAIAGAIDPPARDVTERVDRISWNAALLGALAVPDDEVDAFQKVAAELIGAFCATGEE